MILFGALTALLVLVSVSSAWDSPNYAGYSRVWQETFAGAKGSSPNRGNWKIIDGSLGVNNELQTYTSKSRNVQLSGGSTLQLIPWRDGSAAHGWTSGRLEGNHLVTPGAGKVTRVEAAIQFGENPTDRKQGVWPAFWMLGDAFRRGVTWPACGELDIMESVNGKLTGYGTAHCNVLPGGVCNEPNGIGGSAGIPDQGWHTWRVEFDRRPGNWLDQSISWYMDGRMFHQIRGNRINNHDVWVSLCHRPFYVLLNVAIGGNWVGV